MHMFVLVLHSPLDTTILMALRKREEWDNDHEQYLAEEAEIVQMLAGFHQLHCTDTEEVESDNHLTVACQKVWQVLLKDELWLSYVG